MADALRAEREQRVEQLPASVDEAGDIPPGRSMAERQLHFTPTDRPALSASTVMPISQPKPAARGTRRAALPGERALTGERLLGLEAGPHADERARDTLGEAEAASPPARRTPPRPSRRRMRAAAPVLLHVRVTEQGRRPVGALPLGERKRLTLAAARQAEHPRARSLGDLGRRIAGAVVGDDHHRLRELTA